ncbi:hypothetical protein S245_012349 [Arachis hypogaea]
MRMEKKTRKLLLGIWEKCHRRLPAISGSVLNSEFVMLLLLLLVMLLSVNCYVVSVTDQCFDQCYLLCCLVEFVLLWPAVISTGPGNYPLNASYKAADGYAFQDAVGRSLEEIFNIVPGGCLVFFPSYKLMEKLCNRWSETGQWSRLNAKKPLYVSELSTFFRVLSEYVLDLLVFRVNNLIMVLRSELLILKLIVYGFSP